MLVDLEALATETLHSQEFDVLKKGRTDEMLAYLDLGTLNNRMKDFVNDIKDITIHKSGNNRTKKS